MMSKPRGSFLICGVLISIMVTVFSPIISPKILGAREVTTVVSEIYVDSRKGADTNSGVTRNNAFKTITKALSKAQSNTVISLAGGIYSEETGESFPLVIKQNITLNGIAYGQGQGVVIRGGGSFISPTAAEQNVAIAAINQVKAIKGIMVTNPNSRGHGLWIESASPEVTDSTFSRNGNTGLSVNGAANPLIQNNYFFNNNGNGLLIYGSSAPEVNDNVFDKTGFGISVVEQATPTLDGNQFQGNRIGIILEGESQAVLRNNRIIDSLEYGLVAIAKSQVDLGTVSQPGNNIFRNNQKLDIQNITATTISATGTTVNGNTEGAIDFSASAASALVKDESGIRESNADGFSRLRDNPLPELEPERENLVTKEEPPTGNLPFEREERLPSPPTIGKVTALPRNNSGESNTPRELVFSAPSSEPANDNNSNPSLPVPQPKPSRTNGSSPNGSSGFVNRNENTPIKNPSVLGAPRNSANISSLSDLLAGSNNSRSQTTTYRVLVEFANESEKNSILTRYPQALETVYLSKPMLQVGAFSDRSLAESTSRSLANLGLVTHVLD